MAKRKRGRPPSKNIVFRRIGGRVVPVKVKPGKRILSDAERRLALGGGAAAATAGAVGSGIAAGKLRKAAAKYSEQAKKMHAEAVFKARNASTLSQGKLFSKTGKPIEQFKWTGKAHKKIPKETWAKIRKVSAKGLARKNISTVLMYAGGYGLGALAGVTAAKALGEKRGPGRPRKGFARGWWEQTSSGYLGVWASRYGTQFSYEAAKMKGNVAGNIVSKLAKVLKREEVLKAGKKAWAFKF